MNAVRGKAEEELRKLSRAVEQMTEQVVILDAQGTFEYVNPAFERASGYTAADLVGRSAQEVRSAVEPEEFCEEFWTVVRSGGPITARVGSRRKDGEPYRAEVTVTPLRDAEGRTTHLLATARDIAQHIQLEEDQRGLHRDLERAAYEWRETFDAIESPVLLVEAPGRIVRLNRAALALGTGSYDEVVGAPLAAFAGAEPWRAAAALVDEAAKAATTLGREVRDPASGRTWELTATRVAAAGDHADRVILVARDVTRTVELQESLRRTETLSAMGSLVAGVAHEVRNPLFSISANLDAFEARVGDRGDYADVLDVLRSEVARVNDLMRDLLAFGRPRPLEIETASLDLIVDEAVRATRAAAADRKVTVSSTLSRGLAVCADPRRLAQVFENLLLNAIQHSSEQGRVLVDAHVSVEGDEEWWICFVSDRGPGFAEEDLPRVFEPFFTRRQGGTGLGLALAARIVDDHGGRIQARNRPGGGAALSVKLPRRGACAEKEEGPE